MQTVPLNPVFAYTPPQNHRQLLLNMLAATPFSGFDTMEAALSLRAKLAAPSEGVLLTIPERDLINVLLNRSGWNDLMQIANAMSTLQPLAEVVPPVENGH